MQFDGASASSSAPVDASNAAAQLGNIFQSAMEAVQKAEQVSVSSMSGQASVQEVAESLMNAERQMQFSMAVRDKITSAFLELTHMSI